MTTEYRDQDGKLLRTDKGTQPAVRQKAVPTKSTPAPAPAAPEIRIFPHFQTQDRCALLLEMLQPIGFRPLL